MDECRERVAYEEIDLAGKPVQVTEHDACLAEMGQCPYCGAEVPTDDRAAEMIAERAYELNLATERGR